MPWIVWYFIIGILLAFCSLIVCGYTEGIEVCIQKEFSTKVMACAILWPIFLSFACLVLVGHGAAFLPLWIGEKLRKIVENQK